MADGPGPSALLVSFLLVIASCSPKRTGQAIGESWSSPNDGTGESEALLPRRSGRIRRMLRGLRGGKRIRERLLGRSDYGIRPEDMNAEKHGEYEDLYADEQENFSDIFDEDGNVKFSGSDYDVDESMRQLLPEKYIEDPDDLPDLDVSPRKKQLPSFPKDWAERICRYCSRKGHPWRKCPMKIEEKLAKVRLNSGNRPNVSAMLESHELGEMHKSRVFVHARLAALYRPLLPRRLRKKGHWMCPDCGILWRPKFSNCKKCQISRPNLPVYIGDFSPWEDYRHHLDLSASESIDVAHLSILYRPRVPFGLREGESSTCIIFTIIGVQYCVI
mmetsp:Transcript_16239/g.25976  ORF Transcript_16239/g.25976 Transcript_16239/m.25976 type:complete len:331 (+) Transcript_16239:70-1062(+)